MLAAISTYALIRGNSVYTILYPVAGAILLAGLIIPVLLKPIQKVWMTLAILMGWLMTRVILTVTFYVIFTPIGLISRIFGKDFLNTKRKKEAEMSFWTIKVQDEGTAQ